MLLASHECKEQIFAHNEGKLAKLSMTVWKKRELDTNLTFIAFNRNRRDMLFTYNKDRTPRAVFLIFQKKTTNMKTRQSNFHSKGYFFLTHYKKAFTEPNSISNIENMKSCRTCSSEACILRSLAPSRITSRRFSRKIELMYQLALNSSNLIIFQHPKV